MSINILVTEDESIVRKDIEQTLEKIGYNVVGSADNGEDAIDLAVRLRPDVILMDIMLKGDMNGIAAAEEIKRTLDVPISGPNDSASELQMYSTLTIYSR